MEHTHTPAEHEHHTHEHDAHVHADAADTAETKVDAKNLAINLNWIKNINWKYLITALVVVVIVALAIYYKSLFVAATVDGHIISRISVVKELEKQGGKTALDTLINNQLIQNEAAKKKLTVSDSDINAQIDKIKTQVESQGGTLDAALTQANLTLPDLKDQVKNELLLEKLLGDKIAVTDAEVDKYISDNKVTIPAGQEAAMRAQIKDQLVQSKVSDNGQTFIDGLRSNAKIKTYVNY